MMNFEDKLLLKQEEERLLRTYKLDSIEEVLEFLKYEYSQLLEIKAKRKNEST